MKNIIYILLFCSFAAFGQQISTSQIKDNAITTPKIAAGSVSEVKLAADVGRPIDSGVLASGVLTFDEVREVFSKTVSADLALSLAGSGNIAFSQIILNLTGDGTHEVTWPTEWDINFPDGTEGVFNPDLTQTLTLDYDGSFVTGVIRGHVDIAEVTLQGGIVNSSTADQLHLTFSDAVNITTDGWTLEADGVAVGLAGVTGSGTAAPIFNLVRDIEGDEVLTLSYSQTTGSTASLTGNEIENITDADITGFPATPPADDFDIYVDDGAADDIAAGTIGDPYRTIQAASNAAVAGQVIGIRAGTYRETIVAKNGVTYQEYTGETAIVSGFEIVGTSGWTVHSGNIYKKTIALPVTGYNTSTSLIAENSLNTTIFANQIIRNSVMMIEARYPNIDANGTYGTDDYLLRSKYRNGIDYSNGFTTNNLTDASFPVAAPGLIGATLVCNGWIAQETRTITGHSGNVVSWAAPIWDNGATGKWNRKIFYVTNDLQLLDENYEWHYEGGILYFWQPGGGTPTGTIEYKARNWGFDVRDKQSVTIKGLNFVGCEAAHGNVGTTGAIIDGVTTIWANHHVRHDVVLWQGVGMSRQFGMTLKGANNTVKNSDIGYQGSQGMWMGPGGLVENNYIHDLGYVGYWANGCSPWDNIETGGLKFTRNTTRNTGRSGFDFGFNFHYGDQASAPVRSRKYGFEVSYNDFAGWGSICQDVGATYAWGQNDMGATGVDYHHNWIHDSHAPDRSDVGLNVGIYFDQSTGPGKIHHNVVWAAGAADMYHETHNNTRPDGANTTWIRPYPTMDIYNNTFFNMPGFGVDNIIPEARSFISYEVCPCDRQRNNIYGSIRKLDYGSDLANNVNPGTNPQFLFGNGTSSDIADINTHSGLYFQLASGSPARGIGINNYAGVMGTITDASTDAGAYPFGASGAALWVPGYNAAAAAPPSSGSINDNAATITYSAGNWNYYSPFKSGFTNGDAHVTSALGATATHIFTDPIIIIISEKCDNMGTMRVEIFDDTSVNGTFTDLIYGPVDVDLYEDTGDATAQNPCPNGARQMVFSTTGLAAGDKMIKMTLQTQNNTVVPARNIILLDEIVTSP